MNREIVEVAKWTSKDFDAQAMADLIEAAYLEGRREDTGRAKKSFAPSGIGYGSGTCPRQWYYAFTGGVERINDTDAMGIANMAYGTEAHTRIQDLFERAGILVEAERKVINEDPPVFGFADLVVNWQGEEVVGEIKTTMQESYVSKKAKGKPAGYHLLQVLIYMKVLGLDKGFLLYENKNVQNLLLITVTWTDANKKLAEDTFKWMQDIYANWKAGELPQRPFHSDRSPACKSCDFSKHCWSDETGTVALPALEVPK